LNRCSHLPPITQISVAGTTFGIYPYFATSTVMDSTTGLLRNDRFKADAFSILAPMYLYFRGKVRIVNTSNNTVMMYDLPNYFANNGPSENGSFFRELNMPLVGRNIGNSAILPTTSPFQTPVPVYNGTLTYLQVPYYNKYPVSFVNVWQGDSTVDYWNDDITTPRASAFFTLLSGTWTGSVNMERSFSDDFQLSFFIGCPPLLTGYT